MDHLLWKFTSESAHQFQMVLGRTGVLLFFVHTSLVLMGSSESLQAANPRSASWIKSFYIKRWFRIYPLALVVLTLVVLTNARPGARDPATIAADALLIQNLVRKPSILTVLWTLPIELQMYVLLPLCFFLAGRSVRRVVALFCVAVIAGVVVFTFGAKGELSETPWALFIFAPCFVSGVLAYSILRHRAFRPRLNGAWWPLVLGLIVTGFTIVFHPAWNSPARGWPICLATGLAIPLVSDMPRSWLSRAAGQVAKYSYGIYLLHVPILIIAFDYVHASVVVQWAVFAALIVALPVGAYYTIEAPGIRFGKRVSAGRKPRAESPRDNSDRPLEISEGGVGSTPLLGATD